jgi:hypothetical protein
VAVVTKRFPTPPPVSLCFKQYKANIAIFIGRTFRKDNAFPSDIYSKRSRSWALASFLDSPLREYRISRYSKFGLNLQLGFDALCGICS